MIRMRAEEKLVRNICICEKKKVLFTKALGCIRIMSVCVCASELPAVCCAFGEVSPDLCATGTHNRPAGLPLFDHNAVSFLCKCLCVNLCTSVCHPAGSSL